MRYVSGSRYATKNLTTMSIRNASCPVMSRKKSFLGSPLKKANSRGVKNELYTAQHSMNLVHNRYHLQTTASKGKEGVHVSNRKHYRVAFFIAAGKVKKNESQNTKKAKISYCCSVQRSQKKQRIETMELRCTVSRATWRS
jgi:hypothetical protein